MQRIAHLDADNSAFLLRELSQLQREVYKVQRAAIKFRDLIPPDREQIDPGKNEGRYKILDSYGIAILISSYADNLPRADIKAVERTFPLRPIATSYGWNFDEIDAARTEGISLDPEKREAAFEAAERLLQALAFNGDSGTGIPGFLSNPNIPILTAHDPGGGGTALYWANKTADQILKDLNDLTSYPFVVTNGVETVDTMVLPPALFEIVKNKRIGTEANTTVLKFFLENNQFVKDVDWLPELATAAANGGPRIITYRRDARVLGRQIPREPMELPPQARGLETIVPILGKSGGTIVRYPLACAFMDGAGAVP